MIRTHIAKKGKQAGMRVACNATIQCTIQSDEEHLYFENINELERYNELRLTEKYDGGITPRQEKELIDLEKKSENFKKYSEKFPTKNKKEEVDNISPKISSGLENMRSDLAYSTTSPEALEVLSKDRSWEVRRAVALNVHTPPETLVGMIGDESSGSYYEDINYNVASNPSLTDEQLEALSQSDDRYTRVGIANNPKATPEILHNLVGGELDYYVVEEVIKNPRTHARTLKKILKELGDDPMSNEYLPTIAKHPRATPILLDELSRDSRINIKRAVAGNAKTGPKTLDRLSKSSNVRIKEAVASHPNTNKATLDKLATSNIPDVQYSVLYNPKVTKNTLMRMAISRTRNDVKRAVHERMIAEGWAIADEDGEIVAYA